MKFLPLVLRNLGRRKVRTAFTLLTVFIAFLLFGLLAAVRSAFSQGAEVASLDRLITIHKISLIQPLPIKYGAQIAGIPGVEKVSHMSWFGGYYQEQRNQFAQFAVDPAAFLALHDELVLTDEEKAGWIANRTGAIVGRSTAERFGWKRGDRVPLLATIWQRKDGSRTWEFTIEGIFDAREKGVDTSQFYFHYDYMKEAAAGLGGPGTEWSFVGMYELEIADAAQAAAISDEIDRRFANSEFETKTTTEKAFAQSFANQIGNVGAIVTGIVSVVFFTLLLVAGNTMAQAVRERTGELGVLKTLGFTDGRVLALVLAESLLIALAGGLPGLLLARAIVGGLDLGIAFIPELYIRGEALALGAALVLALGMVTGALPAWQAMRLSIVDALRRT
ncbi:MAG TPA: FtsX-like permease family protein [Thermoanaerobaculia bacterium]|nr:FtsX-like permease family protein [Thermoanaerobaculia bacterium]